jgi:MFS family permease
MDTSSELIHSLLPIFLVSGLGASVFTIGLIEGAAEATALAVKMFSGVLSDYWGKRKSLAVLGYGLAAITKPLFAIAPVASVVLAARIIDRIGKGIRGAPRDALVADITPPEVRGAAFGLRQALDTAGAFIGPLLAIGLMFWYSGDFRTVFWFAVIPAVLAVIVLLVWVHEPQRKSDAKRVQPLRRENIKRLGSSYWLLVIVGAVFTLPRFSVAFLILRAQQTGLSIMLAPLVMVVMNLVFSATAYPFGKFSDRVGARVLLALGRVTWIAADLVLAANTNLTLIFVGVALWGLSQEIGRASCRERVFQPV